MFLLSLLILNRPTLASPIPFTPHLYYSAATRDMPHARTPLARPAGHRRAPTSPAASGRPPSRVAPFSLFSSLSALPFPNRANCRAPMARRHVAPQRWRGPSPTVSSASHVHVGRGPASCACTLPELHDGDHAAPWQPLMRTRCRR